MWLCLCVTHQVIGDLEVQDVRVFLAACPGELNVSYCPAEWLSLLVSLTLAHSLPHSLFLLLFPEVSFTPPLPYCSSAWNMYSFVTLSFLPWSLFFCFFFTTISHMMGWKYPNFELFEHVLKPKQKDSLTPMFSVCQQREFYPSSTLRVVK